MTYQRNFKPSGFRVDYSRTNSNRGPYAVRPQGQIVKHSGCRKQSSWTSKKSGEVHSSPLIHGWNYSRSRGMISFVAVAAKKPATKRKEWAKYVLKMNYRDGRKPEIFSAFWHVTKERLHVPDLGMIANPSKNYFGKAFRTKNR